MDIVSEGWTIAGIAWALFIALWIAVVAVARQPRPPADTARKGGPAQSRSCARA